jgi:hypothetical protein
LTQSKWRDVYLTYYRQMEGSGSNDADADAFQEEKVCQIVKEEFNDDKLDLALPAASEIDDDNGEEEEKDSDGVTIPRIPLWFINAVMAEASLKASPEEREAAEEFKDRRKTVMAARPSAEDETEQDKVARLEFVLEFVT